MGRAVGQITEMSALTQASTAVTQQLYQPAAGSLGGGAMSDQGADQDMSAGSSGTFFGQNQSANAGK